MVHQMAYTSCLTRAIGFVLPSQSAAHFGSLGRDSLDSLSTSTPSCVLAEQGQPQATHYQASKGREGAKARRGAELDERGGLGPQLWDSFCFPPHSLENQRL